MHGLVRLQFSCGCSCSTVYLFLQRDLRQRDISREATTTSYSSDDACRATEIDGGKTVHSWGCIPANKSAGQSKAHNAKEADWDQLFENALSMRWLYPPSISVALESVAHAALHIIQFRPEADKSVQSSCFMLFVVVCVM